MSEEQNVETNDGTWSGLKKTIIATLTTVIAGGGVWLSTQLFGGHEEAPATPVQQAAPIININNTQQQQQSAGKTVIIKEVAPVQKDIKKTENSGVPTPKKKEFTEEPKW